MKSESVPVLITSAIHVAARRTALVDAGQRARWVVHGVAKWRELHPTTPIVLCDGSDADLAGFVEEVPALYGNVEVLRFRNDERRVELYGKGWGEGEIINYALEHSRQLKSSSFFCKCTGKHWVTNHNQFLRALKGSFAFDFYGRVFPRRLDTRYFVVQKQAFQDVLGDAYTLVNEDSGIDLESAYLRSLRAGGINRYVSTVVPRIFGLSGSMGNEFQPSKFHAVAKELRNSLTATMQELGFEY